MADVWRMGAELNILNKKYPCLPVNSRLIREQQTKIFMSEKKTMYLLVQHKTHKTYDESLLYSFAALESMFNIVEVNLWLMTCL